MTLYYIKGILSILLCRNILKEDTFRIKIFFNMKFIM